MSEKVSVPEIFGMNVFNDAMMREHLPKKVYEELKNTIERGEMLNSEIADIIANAMKDWAIERGATHYTHWFQPMTGITAEKHDSFITAFLFSASLQRKSDYGIFRQGADQGGIRCVLLPLRRSACDLRGARLYGLGLYLSCIFA